MYLHSPIYLGYIGTKKKPWAKIWDIKKSSNMTLKTLINMSHIQEQLTLSAPHYALNLHILRS